MEIHQSLRDHRKILAAADRLDIEPPHMIGLMVSLWLWAMDNAPDGDLSRVTLRSISRASQWSNDADAFFDTLVRVGFLDKTDDSIHIHDWNEYAGFLLERRESQRLQGKERQKRYREKQKTVTRDNSVSNGPTVPNLTLPIIYRADKPPRAHFTPPTVDEIRTYCTERGNQVDPQTFLDFYTANGWKQGKGKPIVDWKAAVRTWEKRTDTPAPPKKRTGRLEVIDGEEVFVCAD